MYQGDAKYTTIRRKKIKEKYMNKNDITPNSQEKKAENSSSTEGKQDKENIIIEEKAEIVEIKETIASVNDVDSAEQPGEDDEPEMPQVKWEKQEDKPEEEPEKQIRKQYKPSIPIIDHRLLAGKLAVYDWLSDVPNNNCAPEIVEVRFKNTRKGFYSNPAKLDLKEGDIVAVEAALGHDIGIVSLSGELVKEQMRMKKTDLNRNPLKKVYRKAKPHDIEKWQQAIALEYETMIQSRKIAADLNLNMKIGDVEYQGDKTKAIFYYIAEDRVDFRTLIKVLAETFRIRIEMKQIGARQEAGRIGGIGPCGL